MGYGYGPLVKLPHRPTSSSADPRAAHEHTMYAFVCPSMALRDAFCGICLEQSDDLLYTLSRVRSLARRSEVWHYSHCLFFPSTTSDWSGAILNCTSIASERGYAGRQDGVHLVKSQLHVTLHVIRVGVVSLAVAVLPVSFALDGAQDRWDAKSTRP